MKDAILRYLEETYHPRALLLYGSYIRGDFDEYSDFDCMLLVDEKSVQHDHSVIEGVLLDCFIYTVGEAASEEAEVFLPAFDARPVIDDGTGKALQDRVRAYVRAHEKTEAGEKEFITAWIRKTLKRMQKGDDEGNWRAAALLGESLEDYFRLRDVFYFGSKAAIARLREEDPRGYRLFHEAVTGKSNEAIRAWAEHVMAWAPGEDGPGDPSLRSG